MNYTRWMKETARFARPRSVELIRIDQTLKAYETNLESLKSDILYAHKMSVHWRALSQAVNAWKASKGSRWREARGPAVVELNDELPNLFGAAIEDFELSDKEIQAAEILRQQIRGNTKLMFMGRKLTIRNTKKLADINDVRKALQVFKDAYKEAKAPANAAAGAGAKQELQTMLTQLFGDASAGQIREALGDSFEEFLSGVAPFVGAIQSGAKAIVKWGQAASGLHQRSAVSKGVNSFAPGDPAAAFEAIKVLLTREIHMNSAAATIHTVAASAKAAFTAADFGALSGPLLKAGESLAILVQKIYLFARDWDEMNAANQIMSTGPYDLTLFRTCPLLGCYLIANSDTTSVINMAISDYGRPGWKSDVEAMVRIAQPAFEKARSAIQGSRFHIEGLWGMKGTVAKSNERTLGVSTGKLLGFVQAVTNKINRV